MTSFMFKNEHIILFDTKMSITKSVMYQSRMAGIRTIMAYVKWDKTEIEKGKYDWSLIDNYVKNARESDLKVILRVAEGSPNWVPESWLFHNGTGQIPPLESSNLRQISYWHPEGDQYRRDFYELVCKKYSSENVLVASCVGTSGEHPYPAPYKYADDISYKRTLWCFDEYAISDFRNKMRDKYSSVKTYNLYNGTNYQSWKEVLPADLDKPFYAWADTINWYIDTWYKYSIDIQDIFLKHCKNPTKEIWLSTIPHQGYDPWYIDSGVFRSEVFTEKIEKHFAEQDVITNQMWSCIFWNPEERLRWYFWVKKGHDYKNVWTGAETWVNIVENSKKAIIGGFRGLIVGNPGVSNWLYHPEINTKSAFNEFSRAIKIWQHKDDYLNNKSNKIFKDIKNIL